ncbi:UDP-N-acetylmuramoylalanine--D-glutamate ligase [Burkholderiales bacterium JOSHI_001]|nr:UDP-N-acetylmuramoylalanine--D-glutamate ligase [Burkholderiales bacterium JOSHI_001]
MKFLQDLPVIVLGLGESGLAMARWCARFGARVQVWDSRENPPGADALRAAVPGIAIGHHAWTAETAAQAVQTLRLVLKSPGLAPHDQRIAPLLAAARAAGIAVQGELDLFAAALGDLKAERGYAPRVLAITGTNGKTTTTAMTALLVARAGRRVAMAGNIGPTMLDTLAAALDLEPAPPPAQALAEAVVTVEPDAGQSPVADAPDVADPGRADELPAPPVADDEAPLQLAPPPPAEPVFEHLPQVWVLELSSFQLDGVQGFEPSAGAVLNLTQDHLDWHGDLAAYAAAKARIFGQQGVMVLNADDSAVMAMVPAPEVVKGAKGRPAKTLHRKALHFSLQPPARPGDFGLVQENGMAWLVRALEADETVKLKKGESPEIHLQRLMPADALRVRGRHNAANALAALALAIAIGCPLAPMLHGLREYSGEPHRVQPIGSVGNVEAFDDSKGTNVGATVAALEGLGADKAPAKLVLILGGDGKGQDFTPLAAPTARYARAVALIGRDAALIEGVLAATGVAMQRHDSLEAAVAWCFGRAQPGDAVLLSPACASLDMFRNYGHRAEVFVQAVQALAAERGEVLA